MTSTTATVRRTAAAKSRPKPKAAPAAKAKRRIPWEFRVTPLVGILVLILAGLIPLVISLAGARTLRDEIDLLASLLSNHKFREITGFCALALVLFETSFSLGKRTNIRFFNGKRGRRRSFHMIVGSLLVPLILVHTGGKWGENLNGWLLASLVAVILVGVVGKLFEALRLRKAQRKGGRAVRGKGAFHARWLRLHVIFVSILLVLVGFHVFSVYYF